MFNTVRKHLDDVYDVERLHRRIQLQLLHPCEIAQVLSSVKAMVNVLHLQNLKCLIYLALLWRL